MLANKFLQIFIILLISTHCWSQKIRTSPSASNIITVDKQGTGFHTVQEAFNSIPAGNKVRTTIYVKNGIYKEKLHLDATKQYIHLIGEDKYLTILTYDDHTGKVSLKGDTINTRTSASLLESADNFSMDNITIQNDAGYAAGQAVAAEIDGDHAIINNCRFLGNQDVLFTNSDNSHQLYKNCYIEGTTDFIFGSATVWFEQCHIHSKKNSHITAASTPKDHEYGYVFNDCVLTGDTSLHTVSLGRPWRPYASVIYMHCFIGAHILPEGWRNWNNTESYKTARYAEYQNFGPGAAISRRVSWSAQLTEPDAKKLTIANVLGRWAGSK